MKETERPHQLFWVINYEGWPVEAMGYDCGPNSEGYWWFPKCRFSTNQVFKDEKEARQGAILQAKTAMQKAQTLIERLEQ